MLKYLTFLITLFFCANASAQSKSYTLQECVEVATAKSLSVKQALVSLEQSRSQERTQKLAFLPSANASASHSYNFGRSIDRFSNEFVNTTVRNNFFSLNTNWVLYNGLQQQNTLKMQQANTQAAEQGLKQSKNDIALQVADVFLQYVMSKENIQVLQNQKNQTEKQLELAQKRFEAGSANEGNVLNLQAQLANDDFNITNAQNALETAKMNLRMLMFLPLEENFDLVFNDTLQVDEVPLSAEEVYANAVGVMPQIKRAEAQLEASQMMYKTAMGARAPTVSAFASASTVFSGQAREIIGQPVVTGSNPVGVVDGTGQVVSAPIFDFNTQTIAFGEQLGNNFGQSAGVQVNIPIFNGNRVNNNILTNKTNLMISDLNLQNAKMQLRNEIILAVNNANLALKRYTAANQSLLAQEKSLSFAKKSFEAGVLNYYDYNNARMLYLNAQSQKQSAKYEYIFRNKIVQFYTKNSWDT